jgi:hypothetical protein
MTTPSPDAALSALAAKALCRCFIFHGETDRTQCVIHNESPLGLQASVEAALREWGERCEGVGRLKGQSLERQLLAAAARRRADEGVYVVLGAEALRDFADTIERGDV